MMNLKELVKKKLLIPSHDYYHKVNGLIPDRNVDSLGVRGIWGKSNLGLVVIIMRYNEVHSSSSKRLKVTESILKELE